MSESKGKILRLILGDQLNSNHSWFEGDQSNYTYVFMELHQETNYVRHHIQKIVGFFAAMRSFAEELKSKGIDTEYIKLDDPQNAQTFKSNISRLIEHYSYTKFEYQLPDEYRLDQELKETCQHLAVPSEYFDTEHFLTQREDLENFFKGKKTYLMESFYRHMRKKYDIMMDGDQPITGKWNYDADNRKKLPRGHVLPSPKFFDNDVSEIVDLLNSEKIETIGKINSTQYLWPINREQSLDLLDYFITNLLKNFGDYQDAMTKDSWTLYHSRISFALNTKMIHPLEVVQSAVRYWQRHSDEIKISQIEGFVRQIIGWREYMRGIYWAKMPEYSELNFFDHKRKLPTWFWNGDTKMACLSHAIHQSLDHAYAHHIQRLMVTGNFALLAGVHPDEVDKWYLGIYIDAIEWVEITNTRGMSQFADGGIVGTKPYVSSANYIDKMSHYCKDCYFDKKIKTGAKACPFNSLYWHFYDRHEDKLAKNPRIGMMYRTWARMDGIKKSEYLEQAEEYLENIDSL